METLFIISVAFIVYTYVVYPAVIVAWGFLFPRRVAKRYRTVPVSVVIAAHNEEAVIEARIRNLLEQEYPRDMLEIIVVSDGSTDATVERARSFEEVRVLESRTHAGKAGALNLGVAHASHDVVVFADARQRFATNVVAELVALLSDDTIGAVSGELVIEAGEGNEVQEGVGLYWRYEKLIRRGESGAGSVVGSTGSIYAIRRELYRPLEPHALLDDLLIPMRIAMAGHRVLFSRAARAFDLASKSSRHEFARKVRTLAGNFQAIALEPRLMSPAANPVFFQFVSHKLARLAVPYFCIAALVSSALVPELWLWFWIQAGFYALGFLALTPLGGTALGRLPRLSWTFTVLNAAAVMGLWVFVTGRDRVAWKRRPAA